MIDKSFSRLHRINRVLEKELAILLQNEVNDPRLKHVTITQVQASPDLSHAKIYYTVILDENESMTIEQFTSLLNKTTGYLRRLLAGRLDLRYTPKLQFYFDQDLAQAYRVAELIRK